MNYKQSSRINKLISKSKKIVIGCHRGPDPDCIGSALALYLYLKSVGKEVSVVSPTDIEPYVDYLSGYSDIKVVNYTSFDFSKNDLMIVVDTSSWNMATDSDTIKSFPIPTIIIDHHKTSNIEGTINLVDKFKASCAEVIFLMFEDWGVDFNKDMADCLIAGLVADTGGFRFPSVTRNTFNIASKLIQIGADKDRAILKTLASFDFRTLKFWGEIINRMEIDTKKHYMWSTVSYEKFLELGSPEDAKETAATLFGSIVDGVDFSLIMVEQEKDIISISLRSRTGFDVSKIAQKLGGGGHVYAAGAKVKGVSYNKAVEKILKVINEFV